MRKDDWKKKTGETHIKRDRNWAHKETERKRRYTVYSPPASRLSFLLSKTEIIDLHVIPSKNNRDL